MGTGTVRRGPDRRRAPTVVLATSSVQLAPVAHRARAIPATSTPKDALSIASLMLASLAALAAGLIAAGAYTEAHRAPDQS